MRAYSLHGIFQSPFFDDSISTIQVKFSIKLNVFIFQISLCEDLDELMEAFFRNFKADGVEQPHKLFTGSWRLPTAAQYLGLSAQALDDSVHSYVLVKLDRTKVRVFELIGLVWCFQTLIS